MLNCACVCRLNPFMTIARAASGSLERRQEEGMGQLPTLGRSDHSLRIICSSPFVYFICQFVTKISWPSRFLPIVGRLPVGPAQDSSSTYFHTSCVRTTPSAAHPFFQRPPNENPQPRQSPDPRWNRAPWDPAAASRRQLALRHAMLLVQFHDVPAGASTAVVGSERPSAVIDGWLRRTQRGRRRGRRGAADAKRRELEAYSVVGFRAQLRTARWAQPGRMDEGA